MSVQVKRRRDTAANIGAYTGAQGELIVDVTNNRVTVHDGATSGGWPAAKLSEVLKSGQASQQLTAAPNGAGMTFETIEQSVSLAGATTIASVALPAGCIVFAVSTRVTTAVTGAPSFGVGVAGNPTQFGGSLGIAAGSTNAGIVGPYGVYSATNLVATATSGSFTGGVLRLAIHCLVPSPSLS